jgi:hypothetical protein
MAAEHRGQKHSGADIFSSLHHFVFFARRSSTVKRQRAMRFNHPQGGIFGVPCQTLSADFRPATYASRTIGEGGGSRGISAASYMREPNYSSV